MPRCIASAAATTTTVALTCAQGGTCAVGNTGPGGGIVFYVHSSGTFTSTGSDCNTACKYLEAAPANWQTHASIGLGAGADPLRDAATGGNTEIATGGNQTAIGKGYANTSAFVNQGGNIVGSCAACLARAYTGGTKTDWYLPATNEMIELYTNRVIVGGFTTAGGVLDVLYRTSTELSSTQTRAVSFANGSHWSNGKGADTRVRPVRAFG